MKNCILVTGSNGQLGEALLKHLGDKAIGLPRSSCDLTAHEVTESVLAELAPSVVVNCAAYTQVDRAETDPRTCFAVNAFAVEALAAACERLSARLVQISTDYIFGGTSLCRPWREEDVPAPKSVYARSKLLGEIAAHRCSRHTVIRTCGLYGGAPTRLNFVEKMLRLKPHCRPLRIVDDQTCSPSLVEDISSAIGFIIDQDVNGTYHVVNSGAATWFEFAKEIFRIAKIDVQPEPVTSAEFAALASRPAYSVLDTQKYDLLGGPSLRSWRSALADYLRRRALSSQ